MPAIPNDVDARLAALGVELPDAPKPVANFVPCVRTGDTLFVSGQISAWNGALRHVGKVGRDVSLDEAREAARVCALNVLAQARAHLGDLGRVRRVCMVQGFVNAVPEFAEHPAVLNGASDLFVAVFGPEAGAHARFAVGAGSLPFDAAVEVAAVLEVAGRPADRCARSACTRRAAPRRSASGTRTRRGPGRARRSCASRRRA
jgi:enamine deaminase RidA (YjgF/YER057c/UK114 family)